jgi:hypothetical protein
MNQSNIETVIIILSLLKVWESKLFVKKQKVKIVLMIAAIPKGWPVAD